MSETSHFIFGWVAGLLSGSGIAFIIAGLFMKSKNEDEQQ